MNRHGGAKNRLEEVRGRQRELSGAIKRYVVRSWKYDGIPGELQCVLCEGEREGVQCNFLNLALEM
jgi:hypothetical protein